MVTILVGGTGLMGPHVVRELEEQGREVVCLNRKGEHPAGGLAFPVDRNDFESLKNVFARFGQFSLIDMIPYTAQQASILLDALQGKQPDIVAVSSIDVYQAYNILHRHDDIPDKLQTVPLTEDSVLRTRLSFQGLAYDKLNIERIYQSYFDTCTILRMPAIYGLPDISRVERYVKPLLTGQSIVLHPTFAQWRFSRSLNSNCAFAVSLAANSGNKGVFNVGELNHATEAEWCTKLASLTGLQADIVIDVEAEIPYAMNASQHWCVDSSRIRAELGYFEKYDVDEGLRQVLDFMRMDMIP